jgi:hypothetical protein
VAFFDQPFREIMTMQHQLIVDLDGSIFNNYHRAHLIPDDVSDVTNWDAFNEACDGDLPIEAVIDFVKHLAILSQNKITFATSRCEIARGKTVKQLLAHFSQFDCTLLMRPVDEHRAATAFKQALFESISEHFTEQTMVIEDNDSILKMVRRLFPIVNCITVPSYDCSLVKANPAQDNVHI